MHEPHFFPIALHFLNLLFAALTVGTMFGVWLNHNNKRLSAEAYVELQQEGIRRMNPIMPPLGGITIILTLVSASLVFNDLLWFGLLVGAAFCFMAAGLITRFLNQPLNVIVSTWSPASPPEGWQDVRDEWNKWHALRSAAGLLGLGLLIMAFTLSS